MTLPKINRKTKVEKQAGFLGHHVFHLRSGLSSTRKRSLNLKIQGNNFHNFVAREYTVSINNWAGGVPWWKLLFWKCLVSWEICLKESLTFTET
jgi:hypothetical protein